MEIFKEKKYTKKDKVSFYGEISTKFYILKSGIIRSFIKMKRVNKIYDFYIMDQ